MSDIQTTKGREEIRGPFCFCALDSGWLLHSATASSTEPAVTRGSE
jgi:hypothetical protein